jgi:FtsZ-interacting cell division protein ZipA
METSGPALWLILLTVGVIALAAAIIYGMTRNRKRRPIEEAVTEAATKDEYRREDRDEG